MAENTKKKDEQEPYLKETNSPRQDTNSPIQHPSHLCLVIPVFYGSCSTEGFSLPI